ncbi:MAG: hypothetical protein IKI21_01020 [Oscillospiraceae bacterium]|nr:hypothetical protein [Oscillospiraceae bacterium]
MEKIMYLAMTICAALGFGHGLSCFFRKRSALYIRMIVFGIGCAMLGRLFETLQLFTNGEIPPGFHVGILGVIGSFLFFFSSNYGQMDSLVDDGTKKFLRYRLISLIAPAVMIGLYAVCLPRIETVQSAVVGGIETIVIAMAAYFHLKHVIIPDVDLGIIRSLRYYDLLALTYAVLCMAEQVLTVYPIPAALIAVYVLMCIALLLFVPILKGGMKKWVI